MLPTLSPQFQAYFAPARDKNQIWRLLLGLAGITVFYFTFMVVVMQLGFGLFSAFGLAFLQTDAAGNVFVTPQDMAFAMLTFSGMTIGVVLAARLLHGRGLPSLLGPDPRVFRWHFKLVFYIAFPIFALWLIVSVMIETPAKNLDFMTWLRWLPLALPLLMIQVSAEEILFRGYLQQQLAARFSDRRIWLFGPAILFGLLHYEPSELGPNAWLVVVDTAVFGLIAGDLTARTGNLAAAICLHFVNNFFAIFLMSLQGSMTGLSLYITSFSAIDSDTLRVYLLIDIATYILGYLIYLRAMKALGVK